METSPTAYSSSPGDAGQTDLPGAGRVSKAAPVMDALGSLDELTSALGLVRAALGDAPDAGFIADLQRHVLAIGGTIATGTEGLAPAAIRDLERDIARRNAILPPVNGFIRPGANEASARAHWARSVCRRAERDALRARDAHPDRVSPSALAYLNRLSAWLFALARTLDPSGGEDS